MATECEAVARSTIDDGEAGGEAAVDDPLLVLSKFQEVGTYSSLYSRYSLSCKRKYNYFYS